MYTLVSISTPSLSISVSLYASHPLSMCLHHSLSHTVGNTFTPWCGVCVSCWSPLYSTRDGKRRVFLIVMSIYLMTIGAVGGILIVSGGSVCVYFDDIYTNRPSNFFFNVYLVELIGIYIFFK